MGRRLVSVIGRVKGGAARGGPGRTIRFFDDELLATPSTVYRRSSGGGTQPNPLTPNAGVATTLLVDRASGDAFVTVTDVAPFNVGDLIPIYDGTNTVYKVIITITPATKRLDLDQTLGFAFLASNTIVNAADMEGHIWGYLDDATDKFAQVTEVASGRKLPPLAFPIATPLSSTSVYEEGVLAGTRSAINFIGEGLTAVDNGGANRVDVTSNLASVTVNGDLHKDDKKRLTSQDLGNVTGAITIDLALGHIVKCRATGNISITLSNPLSHSDVLIEIEQDGTGSRTVTWTTTVKWKDAVTPVATTTLNKKDIFLLHRDAADYLGVATLNF